MNDTPLKIGDQIEVLEVHHQADYWVAAEVVSVSAASFGALYLRGVNEGCLAVLELHTENRLWKRVKT